MQTISFEQALILYNTLTTPPKKVSYNNNNKILTVKLSLKKKKKKKELRNQHFKSKGFTSDQFKPSRLVYTPYV